MDKIRKEVKLEDYRKKVLDPEWTGNTFMVKALECVKEEKTLQSFFVIEGDKGIKSKPTPKKKETDNGETDDSQEESPDQKQEGSEGSPQTIFQG